jgi:HD superfamily phosphohydrolase
MVVKKKSKIINDPVYGFIDTPSELIFTLIEHPFFQRLRRIRQLGLTFLIYPGANHTRFQHALGATYLMSLAIEVIRSKGHEITPQEAEAVMIAILLHDIGHGPFSHTLEYSFMDGISHEEISLLFMERLNTTFQGQLSLGITIFNNQYNKTFLHQLVSSQLDMDRLDYLRRDSFFTGVSEGVIGSDRIIKMLNVVDDELVVEAKGIYSIEKFLIARRLMYWQVYLHKTVLAAEQMLIKALNRARYLALHGVEIYTTPALKFFLYNKIDKNKLFNNDIVNEYNQNVLDVFAMLDDTDIISSLKYWAFHSDRILSYLSNGIINRKLFAIKIQHEKFSDEICLKIKEEAEKLLKLSPAEIDYIVISDCISNNAYTIDNDNINILYNTGELIDIAKASDISNVSALSKTVKKHFLCYPKDLDEKITKIII